MPTATLKSTRKLTPKKPTNETGSETKRDANIENTPATGAEYFEIVARATNDAVRDWDVRTGALAWPQGLDSLLGYERSAASENIAFWFDHIHPEDLPRIQASLRETFASTDERWMAEYRFQRRRRRIHLRSRARAHLPRRARRGGPPGRSADGRDRAQAITSAGLPLATDGSVRPARRRRRARFQ